MEDKKDAGSMVCNCCVADCSCGHNHKGHHLARKVLMLIVFLIVFCLGMQIGELKGELRSGRGFYGMMDGRGYGDYYLPRMMGGYGQNYNNWYAPTNTTPAPSTTTPTPQTPIKQ